MAGGLVGAALLSGLGQGMAGAAQTGMQIMGASFLQQQRQAAEDRRLAIMEKYAGEREARGYAHQETMQKGQQDFARGLKQEEFGQNQLSADLAIGRAETAAERERTRQRDPNTITADAAAEEQRFNASSGVRTAKRNEDLTGDIDKERLKAEMLASSPTYLKAVATLRDANQTDEQKADASLKILQAQQAKQSNDLLNTYTDAVKTGDPGRIASAKKAYQSYVEKPWEDDKLTARMASDGLRESGNEIVRLSAQMKEFMPGSPEAAATARRLQSATDSHDAYDAILKTRLGMPAATTKKGPDFANFKDPMKPETLNATKPPAAPGNVETPAATPMDETGAMDWKAATRQSMSNPEAAAAKAFPTAPTAPSEKTGLAGYLEDNKDLVNAIPPGINPTDASSYVAAKRAEAQQRTAMNPAPTGMVGEPGKPESVTKEPIADVNTPAKETPYEAEIQAAAAKYGVNPNLVRAVVKHESNFDPSATSKAGAQGLMQLMPATAKEQGATDPLDPAQNIEAGTKYLSYLLKKYNGDEEQALAAYNFGPGNVDKRLYWPEETQRYVSAVRKSAEGESGPSIKTASASPEAPSYMDVLSKLPGQTRDYVQGQIDEALTALKSGKIDEEEFTGRILAAWTSVPGSPVEYTMQARALAKGLIAEAKGPR